MTNFARPIKFRSKPIKEDHSFKAIKEVAGPRFQKMSNYAADTFRKESDRESIRQSVRSARPENTTRTMRRRRW